MPNDFEKQEGVIASPPATCYARPTKCPQCGDSIVQTNLGGGQIDDYCENCGWPDENRAQEKVGIIERFRRWLWRRKLDSELRCQMGLIASKSWKDRMFQENYPQQTPRKAVRMEFSD